MCARHHFGSARYEIDSLTFIFVCERVCACVCMRQKKTDSTDYLRMEITMHLIITSKLDKSKI